MGSGIFLSQNTIEEIYNHIFSTIFIYISRIIKYKIIFIIIYRIIRYITKTL
nr:MAG TPA: hypothetical protein [Bacteriophage sp.]